MMNVTLNDYTIGECQRKNGYYRISFGETDNGQCFKDENAFNHHPNSPCYVPENAAEDSEKDDKGNILISLQSPTERSFYYTYNDFLKLAKKYFKNYGDEYKEQDIMSAEQLADITFQQVDWQYPETYMQELALFN